MKRTFIVYWTIGLLALNAGNSIAKIPSTEVNPNSLNPIPASEILIRKTLWREIDFLVKPNKPFFSYQAEITRFIIDGVESGELTPYKDDRFEDPMTEEEFFENLKVPAKDAPALITEDDTWGATEEDTWGTTEEEDRDEEEEEAYFAPNEVSTLEIMEDWIFDKVRSQQYYDIAT